MACINPNDPEFKKILKEVGGNPLLAAIEFNELYPEETVPEIKPGVEEVFDSNPELASIGTPEQYSQYLDTVFPDSKVKDIVYHGTYKPLEYFDKVEISEGHGSGAIFFADFKYANYFANYDSNITINGIKAQKTIIPTLINMKNPLLVTDVKFHRRSLKPNWLSPSGTQDARDILSRNKDNDGLIGVDSSDIENTTHVVRDSDQTHILGSKQDIKGFKDFVKSKSFDQVELDPELSNYLAEQISQAFNVPIPTMEKDTLITADEIDAFNRDVENRDGALPKEYFTGVDDVNKWSLNQSNLYDLVDKDTGEIYLRDVNLSTGMMEKKETTPEPVPEKERQEAIDYINNSVKEFRLDEILAERGYDVNDIISNLASAENKEEFNKIINKLLRLLC
jgi:hypothetical protein